MNRQKLRVLLEEQLKIPEEEVLSNNRPIGEVIGRQQTLQNLVKGDMKRGDTHDKSCAAVR